MKRRLNARRFPLDSRKVADCKYDILVSHVHPSAFELKFLWETHSSLATWPVHMEAAKTTRGSFAWSGFLVDSR